MPIYDKDGAYYLEIRTAEASHKGEPHVHAVMRDGSGSITIRIEDAKVKVGSIPNKYRKKAVEYVKNNKDKLLKEWKRVHGDV